VKPYPTQRTSRRMVLAGIAAALTPAPLGAQVPQQGVPVVGYLSPRSAADSQLLIAALKRGLGEAGYQEGRNYRLEFRFAEGRYDALPRLADDLVHSGVSVIVTTGGSPAPRAAKAVAASLPIVFVTGTDPVADGLVQSIARPGGNVTGVMLMVGMLQAKVMEVLHDLLPKADTVAYLVNPSFLPTEDILGAVNAAARRFHFGLTIVRASAAGEIDAAFAGLRQAPPDVLVVQTEPVLNGLVAAIAAHAFEQRLPTIFGFREGAEAGGLASYGPSFSEAFRQAGLYVARILKGDKPADLPVVQPELFDLVINLKTAKALGITISREMLLRANDVIE
jgi:putative tryptophan/tyrosine transport system substrate-binding protein